MEKLKTQAKNSKIKEKFKEFPRLAFRVMFKKAWTISSRLWRLGRRFKICQGWVEVPWVRLLLDLGHEEGHGSTVGGHHLVGSKNLVLLLNGTLPDIKHVKSFGSFFAHGGAAICSLDWELCGVCRSAKLHVRVVVNPKGVFKQGQVAVTWPDIKPRDFLGGELSWNTSSSSLSIIGSCVLVVP